MHTVISGSQLHLRSDAGGDCDPLLDPPFRPCTRGLVSVGVGVAGIQPCRRQHVSQRNGVTYWQAGRRAAVRVDRPNAVSLERLLVGRLQNAPSGGLVHRESCIQYLGGSAQQSRRFPLGAGRLLLPASQCGYAWRPQCARLAS